MWWRRQSAHFDFMSTPAVGAKGDQVMRTRAGIDAGISTVMFGFDVAVPDAFHCITRGLTYVPCIH